MEICSILRIDYERQVFLMLKKVMIAPHPPIVFPEVGGAEAAHVKTTFAAMEQLGKRVKEIAPEVIIAITPHGPVFSDLLTINGLEVLKGDLGRFGAPEVKIEFEPALDLAQLIQQETEKRGLPCALFGVEDYEKYGLDVQLDHGLTVPLTFVYRQGWRGKLIIINLAFWEYEKLYYLGKVLRQTMEGLNFSWVLLASADLSHRLKKGAPAGYSPQGAVFDNLLRECLLAGTVKRLLNVDPALVEAAGECGLRPIIIALGALDGYAFQVEELSYEGPFGVGYLVASIKKGKKVKEREIITPWEQEKGKSMQKITIPVWLARESLSHYLTSGEYLSPPAEAEELTQQKAGAFVTLKKQGELRGCIGTITPTRDNLAWEIIYNAVAAAKSDPRFAPVTLEELSELEFSVDILEEPEKVNSLEDLDPHTYGVIVTRGVRRGLLLPNLEGVNTVAEQVAIAKAKAGIEAHEKVKLERFKVTRYF